jgi:hypothetical protein
MLAAYGVDVLDPSVSLRRIHVLLERLPPHARRMGEQWSIESELLAGLVDSVQMLTWVTLRANGAKGARKPQPVPRPRDRRARPVTPPVPDAPGGQEQRTPGKSSSWLAAAKQLAVIPGVVVTDDG